MDFKKHTPLVLTVLSFIFVIAGSLLVLGGAPQRAGACTVNACYICDANGVCTLHCSDVSGCDSGTDAFITQDLVSTSPGQSFTITWNSSQVSSCSEDYTGPNGTGGNLGKSLSGSQTFALTVPGNYTATISCNGSFAVTSSVTHTVLTNNATCNSITAGPTVTAGQPFAASVNVTNTGGSTWTAGGSYPYSLGSQSPQDNTTWGPNRVGVPTSVPPGGSVTFSGNLTAPSTPGTYTLAWQMVQDFVAWFGTTCSKTITVTAPSCPADQPYTETNASAIAQYCAAAGVTCGSGQTYVSSLSCHSGGGSASWSAYGAACTSPNCTGCGCVAATAPTASLSASPASVAMNGRATLTWGSSNATSCTAGGPWSNSGTFSGSGLTNPLTSDTTFTFQCSTAASTPAPASNAGLLTYSACPETRGGCPLATSISANGELNKSVYAPGEAILLTVDMVSDDNPQLTSGVSPVAYGTVPGGSQSADLFPGTYTPQQLRNQITSGPKQIGTAPASAGSYSVSTSYSAGGYTTYASSLPFTVSTNGSTLYSNIASETVHVIPPPTVTLNPFSPSSITTGQTSTISFSSTNATSCTGTGVISGNVGTSNSGATTPTMNTAGTYTESISCTGPSGSATSATQTLTVTTSAGASCSAVSKTWSTNCSGNTALTTDGNSYNVTNTASGYTGAATYTCSNGSWTGPTNASCTPSSTPTPDLVISVDAASNPASPTAGTAATLSATVKNQGTGAVSGTYNNVIRVDDDTDHVTSVLAYVGTNTLSNTAVNGTGAISASYTFPSAGTYYISACADNNTSMVGSITESNDGNNCGNWIAVTVGSASLSCASSYSDTSVVGASGDAQSIVWGSGPYTDDSDLNYAAVHAGLITAGQSAIIHRTAVGQVSSFTGSTQNGVTTSSWGTFCGVTLSVVGSGASGTISGPNCTIAAGASTCSTTETWSTSNVTLAKVTQDGTQFSTALNGSASRTVGTTPSTFTLIDRSSGLTLDTDTAKGTCASGSGWDGTICRAGYLPDLTAGDVTPTTVQKGTPVVLQATILNQGPVTTGSNFNNFFQMSTLPNGGGTITDLANGTVNTLAANASAPFSKSQTFNTVGTYYLRACADKKNSGDSGQIDEGTNENNNCSPDWVPFTVTGPVPTATLSASPTSINPGGSSTLTWSSTNSTSCQFADKGTSDGTSGNRTVRPTVDSTYSITCTDGTTTSAPALATVTINNPIMTITANPPRIQKGNTATVSWNASNVKSCSITKNGAAWKSGNANGSNIYSGSSVETITVQTTYSMTCTNLNRVNYPTPAVVVVNIAPNFQEF